MQAPIFYAAQAGDCEQIVAGFWGQLVNTASSFAFAAGGVLLAWRGARRRDLYTGTYGLILILVGFGSVAFHGPAPAWGEWLHDFPIAWAAMFALVWNIAEWRRRRFNWLLFAGLALGFMAAFWLEPIQTDIVAGVVAAPLVAFEGRRFILQRRGRVSILAVAILLIVGFVIGRLGSTAGPICDPSSVFQAHALWHLMAAGALTLWGLVRLEPASLAVAT